MSTFFTYVVIAYSLNTLMFFTNMIIIWHIESNLKDKSYYFKKNGWWNIINNMKNLVKIKKHQKETKTGYFELIGDGLGNITN